MENLRKRTEREVADARLYGISTFARDILTVADSMHRALEALDDELRAKADAGMKALLDGVELTERELMNALEKHGVKRIEPLGQKFDPNRHQAMYEVEEPSVPSGRRGAGGAGRLSDRRTGVASGAGRGVKGGRKARGAARQTGRQSRRECKPGPSEFYRVRAGRAPRNDVSAAQSRTRGSA